MDSQSNFFLCRLYFSGAYCMTALQARVQRVLTMELYDYTLLTLVTLD